MGLFDKFSSKNNDSSSKDAVETPPCPHVVLLPRWDSADDIGHEDRASNFLCESCGSTFSPVEVQALRATEAERLPSRDDVEVPHTV